MEPVSYKIALLAKEKGFDFQCLNYYSDENLVSEDELLYHIRNGSDLYYNWNAENIQDFTIDEEGNKVIPTSAHYPSQIIDWIKYHHNVDISYQNFYNEIEDKLKLI